MTSMFHKAEQLVSCIGVMKQLVSLYSHFVGFWLGTPTCLWIKLPFAGRNTIPTGRVAAWRRPAQPRNMPVTLALWKPVKGQRSQQHSGQVPSHCSWMIPDLCTILYMDGCSSNQLELDMCCDPFTSLDASSTNLKQETWGSQAPNIGDLPSLKFGDSYLPCQILLYLVQQIFRRLTNKCAVDVVLSWKFRTNHLILFKKNLEDLQWLAISNDASRRTRKKNLNSQGTTTKIHFFPNFPYFNGILGSFPKRYFQTKFGSLSEGAVCRPRFPWCGLLWNPGDRVGLGPSTLQNWMQQHCQRQKSIEK